MALTPVPDSMPLPDGIRREQVTKLSSDPAALRRAIRTAEANPDALPGNPFGSPDVEDPFARDLLRFGLTPRGADVAERTLTRGARWLENNSSDNSDVTFYKVLIGLVIVAAVVEIFKGRQPESQADIARAQAELEDRRASRLRAEATANTAALGGGRGPNGGPAETRNTFDATDATDLRDILVQSATVFLGAAKTAEVEAGITVQPDPSDGSMTVTVTDGLLEQLNATPFKNIRLNFERGTNDAGATVWKFRIDGRDGRARQNLNAIKGAVRTGRDLRRAEEAYTASANRIAREILAVRTENGSYTAVLLPFTADAFPGNEARAGELRALLIARAQADNPALEIRADAAPGDPIRITGLTLDVVTQMLRGNRYRQMS